MKYEVNNRLAGTQQNISTTYGATSVAVSVFGTTGALVRGKLVEYAFGADGAPNASDCQIVYDVSRMTADARRLRQHRSRRTQVCSCCLNI